MPAVSMGMGWRNRRRIVERIGEEREGCVLRDRGRIKVQTETAKERWLPVEL